MRAEEVIATHGNTDFDAFASMLAARRLYPEAVVCVSGSLSRNVREFARLHAEELEVVDVGRLELDAIRRLVVVDTIHAGRLVEVGGIDVLVAGAATRESDVSVSTLAHKLVDLHDSRALACLVETSERVFCAIRSSAPELDAAAAAAILGGGGHAQAASATFRGTLEDARERLLGGLAG